MAFLAPFLLWGTLAASIPIALHLFFRSRYRTVPWAAMKFLLTSVEQTSRRLRFQELLLLMLRILLLVIIALALARPIVSSFREMALLGLFIFLEAFALARLATSGQPLIGNKLGEFGVTQLAGLLVIGLLWYVSPTDSAALGSRGDAVDAVFVFDTSMSMGAKDGGKTRLERGRAEALRIIDQLPPHSTVQIVTCAGGRQALVGPRSAANLDQARGLLAELTPTELGTDLLQGVERAAKIIERGQSPNRELYLFTDMQKQGWQKNAGKLKEQLTEVKDNTKASVVLVRCGTRPVKNVALVAITPQGGMPRPGSRASFAVVVRNTGKDPVENLTVGLLVDGDEKGKETQSIAGVGPGETRTVPLSAKLEKAGLHVLTATVGPDDLDGDNRLDRVIQVRDFVRILIVDGNHNEREPEKSSSYRLAHALLPAKDADAGTFYFQPQVVPSRLAAPALLAKSDLCILTDVALEARPGGTGGMLKEDFVAALEPYVRAGHGLIIFAGNNVTAESYNRVLGRKHHLLPMPLSKTVKRPVGDPLFFNRDTLSWPAFERFRSDKLYASVAGTAVWQYVELETPAEDAGKNSAAPNVLLRYDQGQSGDKGRPAIVTRSVDAGEVVFVTTASHSRLVPGKDGKHVYYEWSVWADTKLFVPFIHTLVNSLMHNQSDAYNLTTGEVLHWYPSDKMPHSYTLLYPDGKTTVRLGQPKKEGKRLEVTADELPRAGVYRLTAHLALSPDETPPDSAGVKDRGIPIAAAPDFDETADLATYENEQDLNALLGFTPLHLIADSGAEVLSAAERLNREWTGWLLLGVLAMLACEAALAWLCGRAW
jgi:hypothetical protein